MLRVWDGDVVRRDRGTRRVKKGEVGDRRKVSREKKRGNSIPSVVVVRWGWILG